MIELLLRAYGSGATWSDVVRVAIIRLVDLAEMSIEKAAELAKPHLRDDAADYVRDANFLREVMRSG